MSREREGRVDPQGNLITANHGKQGIVRFSVPGAHANHGGPHVCGQAIRQPKRSRRAKDGTIYFTDSTHQTTSPQQPGTHVYQVLPGTTEATIITDYTNQPNGISLSLDENTCT